MLGRALSWATIVWEQQSAICGHLEEFMAEVRKVFESPVSGRKAASKLLDLRQIPVVWQTTRLIFARVPGIQSLFSTLFARII